MYGKVGCQGEDPQISCLPVQRVGSIPVYTHNILNTLTMVKL